MYIQYILMLLVGLMWNQQMQAHGSPVLPETPPVHPRLGIKASVLDVEKNLSPLQVAEGYYEHTKKFPLLNRSVGKWVVAEKEHAADEGMHPYLKVFSQFRKELKNEPQIPIELHFAAKTYEQSVVNYLSLRPGTPERKEARLFLAGAYEALEQEHAKVQTIFGSKRLLEEKSPIPEKSFVQTAVQFLQSGKVPEANLQAPQLCRLEAHGISVRKEAKDPCHTEPVAALGHFTGSYPLGSDPSEYDSIHEEAISAWLHDAPGFSDRNLVVKKIHPDNAQYNLGIFDLKDLRSKEHFIVKVARPSPEGTCKEFKNLWSLNETVFSKKECHHQGGFEAEEHLPGLPKIRAWARSDSLCFALMDKAPGIPFAQYYAQLASSEDRARALGLLGQTIAALHFHQGTGLNDFWIHGDLHRNNLMVDPKHASLTLIDAGAMQKHRSFPSKDPLAGPQENRSTWDYDMRQLISPVSRPVYEKRIRFLVQGASDPKVIHKIMFPSDPVELSPAQAQEHQKILPEIIEDLHTLKNLFQEFNAFLKGYLPSVPKHIQATLKDKLLKICEEPIYLFLKNSDKSLNKSQRMDELMKDPRFVFGEKQFPEIQKCRSKVQNLD